MHGHLRSYCAGALDMSPRLLPIAQKFDLLGVL
jgi:hypothetical protein